MFANFIPVGFDHIITGYDHLLFLGALIVASRRWQDLLAVISAFTIAHTITIFLTVFGFLSLPSLFVESLIALSIVYAAASNLVLKHSDNRWLLAGAFGLVHGAGFSGLLAAMVHPMIGTAAAWTAIFGFSTGIELGQLSLIVLLYPLIVWARKTNRQRLLVRWPSGAIAVAGTVLLVLRLAGGAF
ncbi:MAG: HupE/UreJ family protein [Bacteroidota bacterium]|nr:HupE/UreJ family protein [Bacteroidota bacterium]MDP4232571.1 HupE/UreJ family protein [Bacteroidota bacterium]MDP4242975.1 HupE/UreJ family protein [Bacteroidota bacterium]MDP4286450.1 HupE/UreJ family protein [Bacteroidota bacterium]